MSLDEEDDDIIIFGVITVILKYKEQMSLPRRLKREKLLTGSRSGKDYIKDLLEGSGTYLYSIIRMKHYSFYLLCDHFRNKGYACSSKHLDLEEKMLIFLVLLAMKHSNRYTAGNFQHSASTISKCFHEVLNGMIKFSAEMIVPTKLDEICKGTSGWNRKLLEGPFRGAYGAIDGTLINTVVPKAKQPVFRAKGGKALVQNVLGVCDFNMCFTFVLAGVDGVAHDARVLNAAVNGPSYDFPLPPEGKYYLCDAAYAHTKGFMPPYRNKRYWLKYFRNGGPSRDPAEKYNHCHSQLRNVIERTFGVLKNRFPLLKEGMLSYSFATQTKIVIACMTIHNFLRRFAKSDEMFDDFVNKEVSSGYDSDDEERASFETTPANQRYAIELRNEIANELFAIP